jgi:hypothetical protein
MWYETVREELKKARQTGQPWHVLAGIMRRVLERVGADKHGQAWRIAARETGLSEVMLRRYLGALDRLQAIEKEASLPVGNLLSATFAPAELALRLHSRDPVAGLKALNELTLRKITVRDIRKELGDGGAPDSDAAVRGRSIRDRGILVARCEGLVGFEAATLFGTGTKARRRPSAKYFRRVGFEFRDPEGDILGGGDLYLAESGGRDPLDGLAQSVVLAKYLPAFYVIIGPDLDAVDADRAADALEALDAPSLGVLLLRDEGPALVVRKAEVDPARGRPEKYVDLLKRFASGRSPTAAR